MGRSCRHRPGRLRVQRRHLEALAEAQVPCHAAQSAELAQSWSYKRQRAPRKADRKIQPQAVAIRHHHDEPHCRARAVRGFVPLTGVRGLLFPRSRLCMEGECDPNAGLHRHGLTCLDICMRQPQETAWFTLLMLPQAAVQAAQPTGRHSHCEVSAVDMTYLGSEGLVTDRLHTACYDPLTALKPAAPASQRPDDPLAQEPGSVGGVVQHTFKDFHWAHC